MVPTSSHVPKGRVIQTIPTFSFPIPLPSSPPPYAPLLPPLSLLFLLHLQALFHLPHLRLSLLKIMTFETCPMQLKVHFFSYIGQIAKDMIYSSCKGHAFS